MTHDDDTTVLDTPDTPDAPGPSDPCRACPRGRCELFLPGHNVHWIQARLAGDPTVEQLPVALSNPRGGYFDAVVRPDCPRRAAPATWWLHDARQAADLCERSQAGAAALLALSSGLLRVQAEDGTWLTAYPADADAPRSARRVDASAVVG